MTRGRQARRSGPSRGAAKSAAFRRDTTRQVTVARPSTPEERSEAAVEGKRKAYIVALGRDQRLTRNSLAVSRFRSSYWALLVGHMVRFHDGVPEDVRQGACWDLDDLHEKAHGR